MRLTALALVVLVVSNGFVSMGCLSGDGPPNLFDDRRPVKSAGAVGMLIRIPFSVHVESDIRTEGSAKVQDWKIWGEIGNDHTPEPTVIYRHQFDAMVGNRVGKTEEYILNGRIIKAERKTTGTVIGDLNTDFVSEAEKTPKPITNGGEFVLEDIGDRMNTVLPFYIHVEQASALGDFNTVAHQSWSMIFFVRFPVPDMYDEGDDVYYDSVELFIPLKELEDPSDLDVKAKGYDGNAEAKWTQMRAVTKTWLDLSWLSQMFGLPDFRLCTTAKITKPEITKYPTWDTPIQGDDEDQVDLYQYRLLG